MLRNLYALQLIDLNLDELEEMKGDLPAETRELEAKVADLQRQLNRSEQIMKTAFASRDSADNEIVSLNAKAEKYKAQQFQVRNNKEYDALTKEMDGAVETIARLGREMEALETQATVARTEIETTKAVLEEVMKVLDEKRQALLEVSKTTEEEELKFKHEREKMVARIKKSDLAMYERIRKAKKGKAVVPVRRGACGGCFNKVPPQMLLELRQNNKFYTCEHCGRIIVSDDIAVAASQSA